MGRASAQRKRLSVIAGVLAAAVVGGLVYLLVPMGRSNEGAPEQQGKAQDNPFATMARRTPGDPMALGRQDAPVVMIDYSDYRCPFCAKFTRDLKPELVKRYVDTGVLRIEWRDFPIFGAESFDTARAGRAAAAQGKFWQYMDVVHRDAPQSGHPELPREKLVGYAGQAGIADIPRFESDMDNPATLGAVQADAAEGSRLGVPTTPAFLINGNPVLGAQPLDRFIDTIEKARTAAR
ncbi:thioredoxin domain-containing protein [Saccharopolyspora oryzae]|uniref:Thioredoxin domain-containing protein n=1 Tax=Saccharopolyspora oryzae TaxID=2997343 RepID=A0ABT4UU27_9PSEU|nr:thioredoxin domain-containing protein [Saccharopolyspora oryzae]MDA3625229.1 thioredoxin domain-containing protein [Saccharopolyspora oryzae]